MSRRGSLCLVLALLVASAAHAQQEEIRDTLLAPLPLRDQFLLNNGFFFFEPSNARVLGQNEWLIDFHFADANTFAKSAWISRSLEGQTKRVSAAQALASSRYDLEPALYLVDGETHRATLSLHAGVGSHVELGVAVPISTIGGGSTDSLVENAHHLLGIGNAERESLRRNSEAIYFRSAGGTYLRERSAGTEIGDIALTAKCELPFFEEQKLAVSVEAALELPTANARTLAGSGSTDGGFRLLVSQDFGRWRAHASAGILLLGPNAALATKSQLLTTEMVALSRLITDRTSGTIQLTVSESPFRKLGMPEFTRRSYQLTGGLQHQFRTMAMYLGFMENILTYENSADAAMIWGVSKRF